MRLFNARNATTQRQSVYSVAVVVDIQTVLPQTESYNSALT